MRRAIDCARDGMHRAVAAPAIVAGTFALTVAVALPLSLTLEGLIAAHLGRSLVGEATLVSPSYGWWQEFLAQATGLGTTFVPSVLGFGAVLQDLSNLLDDVPLATTIAGVTAAWLVIWSFLSGGIIDRLARGRPTRARGFFGAAGAHFPGIVRLGLIALILYWLLFSRVHPFLLGDLYGRVTRDMTVERSAFAVRVLLYVVFGGLLVVVNAVVDYARIRLVVEDRRSAVGALLASIRFLVRHPGQACGVYAVNGILFLLLVGIYAFIAPPASAPGWLILLVGELYIVARHFLKATFYASEISLFQRTLAHAGYTARPPLVWPESAAAEAIVNAGPVP